MKIWFLTFDCVDLREFSRLLIPGNQCITEQKFLNSTFLKAKLCELEIGFCFLSLAKCRNFFLFIYFFFLVHIYKKNIYNTPPPATTTHPPPPTAHFRLLVA